jgi:ribosome biogenesis GTPase A
MNGRTLKAMVVGIPNVGKSSLVNRLCGAKKAKVENRPGVTLNKQWVSTSIGIDLMDMPGVLWPKFDDPIVGENLAVTGAIRDAILDLETLAGIL